MHRINEIHTTSLSSYFFGCHLQYKLLGTRSRPMDTQSAISYFSKKMFAVGTHWKRLFKNLDVQVQLDLLAGNTCTYPNSFGCIFIHVWVSAITMINYNQPAPMYIPKLQFIKHRSHRNAGSNSKLWNY